MPREAGPLAEVASDLSWPTILPDQVSTLINPHATGAAGRAALLALLRDEDVGRFQIAVQDACS
jgi:hypothetical protein